MLKEAKVAATSAGEAGDHDRGEKTLCDAAAAEDSPPIVMQHGREKALCDAAAAEDQPPSVVQHEDTASYEQASGSTGPVHQSNAKEEEEPKVMKLERHFKDHEICIFARQTVCLACGQAPGSRALPRWKMAHCTGRVDVKKFSVFTRSLVFSQAVGEGATQRLAELRAVVATDR